MAEPVSAAQAQEQEFQAVQGAAARQVSSLVREPVRALVPEAVLRLLEPALALVVAPRAFLPEGVR